MKKYLDDIEIGTGATWSVWSDRYPATVVEVIRFKSGANKGKVRGVVVQNDDARVISGSAHDGSAKWECTPNPDAPRKMFLWNATQERFQAVSDAYTRLHVGHRDRYEDPHI